MNPGQAGWGKVAAAAAAAAIGAVFTWGSQTTLSDILDGASNTYLFGEKYVPPDAYADKDISSTSCLSDCGDAQGMYVGFDDDIARWVGPGNNADSLIGETYRPMQDHPGVWNWLIYGSAHLTGFNVAMCDGSVHTINYSIDMETHRRLGNRADGQPISTSPF